MSQHEDDLRALAKIMDFLRATSIVLVIINIYWFCPELHPTNPDGFFTVVDRVLNGFICLLMAGNWMNRLLKTNLMNDVFNNENESFQQETRKIKNEYSINLPTRFYHKKNWNDGWINVVKSVFIS